MADHAIACNLLLYTFLLQCVQGCYTYYAGCSWYYSWYIWFGVSWIIIIGIGIFIGIYRHYKMRQMQVGHNIPRGADGTDDSPWKNTPGYGPAVRPPMYEEVPRYPSAAPPSYPGSPDFQSEQLSRVNYYNPATGQRYLPPPSYSSPPNAVPSTSNITPSAPRRAHASGSAAYPPPQQRF